MAGKYCLRDIGYTLHATLYSHSEESALSQGPPGVMQIGGSQANGPSTAGLLDIFGCAVNNRR